MAFEHSENCGLSKHLTAKLMVQTISDELSQLDGNLSTVKEKMVSVSREFPASAVFSAVVSFLPQEDIANAMTAAANIA